MTGIVKGAGKIVKGATKAVKGIVGGVAKAFKAVTKSDLGKMLILAATVYFGGAALGYWNSGFAAVDGALVASQASLGSGIAASPAAALSGTEAAIASQAAPGTIAATNIVPGAAAIAPAAVAPSIAPAALAQAAPGVSGAVSNAGIISNAIKGTGAFVKANPLVSAMGLNAISSMMGPDEQDLADQAEEQRKARLAGQQQNLLVGGVDVGLKPGDKTLYDSQGNPVYDPGGGLIRRQLNRGTV
jgi:hypothetical protein